MTAAILRRALVTAEGACVLMFRGLMEPAFATFRTLLDLEVSIKHAPRDDTDRMARRLALGCAIQYKSHGQDMLANYSTREESLRPADRIAEIMGMTKVYAELVKSPAFGEARDPVKADAYWHGFKNTETVYKSVGQESDYHMSTGALNPLLLREFDLRPGAPFRRAAP